MDRLFDETGDIAAVLYEPMLANAGCLMPAPGYLEHVQAVARRHGALLIADEVLMGFRLRPGLTSHGFGLDLDLATLGKAMASGIAAAVAGRAATMDRYHALNGPRAGTYSGNPVACAAVTATMSRLDKLDYPALLARGDALRAGIERGLPRGRAAVADQRLRHGVQPVVRRRGAAGLRGGVRSCCVGDAARMTAR